MNSSPNFHLDEHKWVEEIRINLEKGLEEEAEIPVSIFNVPKILLTYNPSSYVPQEVAIGPYHYFHPQLYEMEKYKIVASKRIQKHLGEGDRKFQHHVVDQLKKYEPRIRAHYHKYLPISGETLAWIMAMDACFLLEFLHVYTQQKQEADKFMFTRISSRMSHLLDSVSTNSIHNAILRDLVMLENQIPLFILKKMLEFQSHLSPESSENLLLSMLLGFSMHLSPFKTMEQLPQLAHIQVRNCAHLLDFIYKFVVPKSVESSEIIDVFEEKGNQIEEEEEEEKQGLSSDSHVTKLFNVVWEFIVKSDKGPVRIIKRIVFSKPFELIGKLPWQVISHFPVFRIIQQPIENLFFNKEKTEENESIKKAKIDEKAPLVEEIIIPSVTELFKAGVQFVSTNNGISSIEFDPKTRVFRLPVVFLDANTEVVLRNLVAYEACSSSGPLVFTRYTELMNGIIDTEEDAKFLREKGIIVNLLKKDNEVANLWNGMSKSFKLTKVDFLDKAIADLNKFYNGRWKIKANKFLKQYIYGSWRLLTLLAALLFLFFMGLQAFCSVYSCPRLFNHYVKAMGE